MLAAGLALGGSLTARSQDAGALLDLLVKKRIITDQEAEEVRSQLVKDVATTSAGKWKISAPITEVERSFLANGESQRIIPNNEEVPPLRRLGPGGRYFPPLVRPEERITSPQNGVGNGIVRRMLAHAMAELQKVLSTSRRFFESPIFRDPIQAYAAQRITAKDCSSPMTSPTIRLFTSAALLLSLTRLNAQPPSPTLQPMTTHHAKGTFEVTLKPVPLSDSAADGKLGRMSFDKQFAGNLVGTSKGEMLSAQTDTKGSAGYVAIEKVVGEMDGRKGTFVLQHSGTMDRGQSHLTVVVVPASGTEGFAGIKGTMQIDIKEGKHFYDFEYSLP
jgi:hypothetical protein